MELFYLVLLTQVQSEMPKGTSGVSNVPTLHGFLCATQGCVVWGDTQLDQILLWVLCVLLLW
jgi:hypothetical protein